MSQIKNFEEMPLWNDARLLVGKIYEVTRHSSLANDFHLVAHLRKTAISIASNISEGFERDGNREFLNFLSIAKGSCGELRCQIIIAYDQGYLDQIQFEDLVQKLLSISRSISNFMKYLKNSEQKGRKYH